jgi:hypothetical protein
MKKLLLILFLIVYNNTTKALNIQNITITSNSDSEINILLNTVHGSCMFYNSYTYSITDNSIILNVCYNPQFCNAVTYLSNNIQIPLNNLTAINYELKVNIFFYNFQTLSCENSVISDSETLNFSTPLNTTVTLSSDDFVKNENNLIVSPNPSNGMIEFSNDFVTKLKSIKIFDNLGRLVQSANTFNNNSINLKEFENGIYYIEFATDKEKISKKILIKK